MKTIKASWLKFVEYFQKFKKPLQLFGELTVGTLCAVVPYLCGEIFEGYIMQTNTKGMSDYEIIHLDKVIDFSYALVAVVTVELVLLMLKQLLKTLDWHMPKLKMFESNTVSAKMSKGQIVLQLIKDAIVIIVGLIVMVIPYTMATQYEDYVMHLNVVGQSKLLISHLSKSIYFSYVVAAVVTIKLIMIFIKYARHHFGFKHKGNK